MEGGENAVLSVLRQRLTDAPLLSFLSPSSSKMSIKYRLHGEKTRKRRRRRRIYEILPAASLLPFPPPPRGKICNNGSRYIDEEAEAAKGP